ncbi:MAG: metallopeptidase family protein [Planctomycetota bacterium]
MTDAERDRFDALLEGVIDELPAPLRDLLQEAPVIVDDRPEAALLRTLLTESGEANPTSAVQQELAESLCGLHTGVPLTEQSIEMPIDLPTDIRLFREGILITAGGWLHDGSEAHVREEIAITLLHEIGHHFGLDEDDLEQLGYG